MDRSYASRLSKINHVKKLYRQALERKGNVSKTKLSNLKAKASELQTFANDAKLGELASTMAGIAISVARWSESKDNRNRELEFIAEKIKAADEQCRRLIEEE